MSEFGIFIGNAMKNTPAGTMSDIEYALGGKVNISDWVLGFNFPEPEHLSAFRLLMSQDSTFSSELNAELEKLLDRPVHEVVKKAFLPLFRKNERTLRHYIGRTRHDAFLSLLYCLTAQEQEELQVLWGDQLMSIFAKKCDNTSKQKSK